MAKSGRKKNRIPIKTMRHKNDPMVRFYDKTQEWLQEKGRPFMMVLGVIVGAVVLYAAWHYFSEYRESKAKAAFAEAFDKYSATVQDASAPLTSGTPTSVIANARTYPDEQTKWTETAEAFERLANDYSGYYGTIGLYYAGASYLRLDPEKGIGLLRKAADENDQPTSSLAQLALAEHYLSTGDTEQAIGLYQQLAGADINLKPAVQYGLGRAYEKSGNTEKAVEAYMESMRAERSSEAGRQAERRVSVLAPDRLKELPPAETPFVP